MTQKQAYISNPKLLLEDIEALKVLKTQVETEKNLLLEQKNILFQTLGILAPPEDIDLHIANVSKELEQSLEGLNIPEDLIAEYKRTRRPD